jgi:hypothetical protein
MRSSLCYLLACLVAVSIVCVTGCQKGGQAASAPQVQFSRDVTFEDIPVPAGFKLERKKSYSFQNDVTRVGRLSYEGRSSINNVLAFYQQQMPLHGWQEMSYVDYGSSIRYFEKGGQSCIITVEPSPGYHNVRIILATQPKSK